MNPARLLTHFDRISDAPGAIPRLRRFVLDLAVRGKLVEQEPNDEPASELHKRIQAEKARLVKEGTLKELEPFAQIDSHEGPYEIPANWRWVPLGETVNSHLGGGTPSKNNSSYWSGDIRWASVKDVGKTKYLDATIDRITADGLADSSSNLIPPGNLIVVTRMGLGKVSINRVPIAINQDLRALSLSSLAVIDYHYVFFKTHGFKGTGLTVKGIKVKELMNIPFPLPPLAEQRRIVAKVDELMALCDRLEAAQVERERRRDRLTAASLYRLNQPADPGDAAALREHARFHLRHLPRLSTRSDQVPGLRQTILSLAVRGQLVPQDPNDEPASELLAKVAAQKTKAGSATTGRDWVGDIARPVDEAFVAPHGWAWTRIGNGVERVTVGYVGPMKDQYVEGGIPFLRSQNVRPNRFREDGLISISPIFHQSIAKSALAPGDVVVVRSGNVGTACVVPPSLPEANCSDLVVVKNPAAVLPTYLCFYLNSIAAAHIEAGAVGVALTHFNTKSVATMPLPLPPLAEQHRIVAKVEELMAVCDQLEAQLATAESESRRFLEAILKAVAPVV